MKRTIVLPALVTAFAALSPVGAALATPSPGDPGDPAPLPVVNVANPGSGVFCNADNSSCWIEHGDCAEDKPYSPTRMARGCG
jgi:hypothetical protein